MLKDTLHTLHNPQAALVEGHVCRIWEDFEVTMTKSGSLLDQRAEHMIIPPSRPALPVDLFPCQYGGHAFIFVAYADYETALAALQAAIVAHYE